MKHAQTSRIYLADYLRTKNFKRFNKNSTNLWEKGYNFFRSVVFLFNNFRFFFSIYVIYVCLRICFGRIKIQYFIIWKDLVEFK